jgi:hypothetical protein
MLIIAALISVTLLACTFVIASTWLRAAEMTASEKPEDLPRASATASLTIEYAALKERVRKLERIADGLEA